MRTTGWAWPATTTRTPPLERSTCHADHRLGLTASSSHPARPHREGSIRHAHYRLGLTSNNQPHATTGKEHPPCGPPAGP